MWVRTVVTGFVITLLGTLSLALVMGPGKYW